MLVLQAIGSGAGQVLEPARAVAERNGADGGAKRSCWRSGAERGVWVAVVSWEGRGD